MRNSRIDEYRCYSGIAVDFHVTGLKQFLTEHIWVDLTVAKLAAVIIGKSGRCF